MSVASLWASHTYRASPSLLAALAAVRKRGDTPDDFPNKAALANCLIRAGHPLSDYSEAWDSFRAYRDRARGLQDTLPTSWAEAVHLGRSRWVGEVCPRDADHGNIRAATKNRRCIVCRKNSMKSWVKRVKQHKDELIEYPEPTDEEIQMFNRALAKTARRR